jgi:DNA polymerase III alpha subunit
MCSKNKDFSHLHVHSFFSVQDALPSPEQLILGAKKQGFTALALTDHGKMGGHVEFADAAHKNGIKPILGCEFYVAKNRFDKATIAEDGSKKREKLCHLTVLAQNEIGYKNMLNLGFEASKPECYYYMPRIDFNYLSQNSEGLIVLSGCLASELNQALLKGTYDEAMKVAKKYKEVFGDRYFIELQYHGIEEQKHNSPYLVKIAKELDIKLVASNDVHYVEYQDWKLHDVLIQMKDLRDEKTSKNTGKKEAYGSHQFYLKSYDQMAEIFGAKVPEALSNTKLIEEMVDDFYKVDLPHSLPEGRIDTENKQFISFWQNNMSSQESKEAYLAYQAALGLKNLGLDKDPDYVKRLKYEVETVWYMGVTDYFLIQKEMVDFMKSKNILYGVRGSGVGSLLNYCLGISYADPIKFGLMFERFLNPGRGNQYLIDLENFQTDDLPSEEDSINWIRRTCNQFIENEKYKSLGPRIARELWILENQKVSRMLYAAHLNNFKLRTNKSNFYTFFAIGLVDKMPSGDLIIKKVSGLPDIDTDIDDSRRHEVIDWAKDRFGEDNVKAVGTWGTYKAKAAVLGVLKTSDKFRKFAGEELAQKALRVSATIPGKPGTTIESAIKESPDFQYWSKKFPEEIENAANLNGVIQNLGVHAAAVVVSKFPIHEVVPIENSKNTLCTGFDMSNVERTGIVKYDYLGLATYRQISIALKLIKQRHNVNIEVLKIPLDDPKVYKTVFEKGNTITVFQFSGGGMQKALKEVRASTMEDLIAVAALYRPGPMDYITDYAKGKFNPDSIHYAHPLIKKHLSSTYGIMVYQEQAMFLAREMANLDWIEVDKLRKGIAKKEGTQFDEACINFAKKAAENDIPQNAIKEVLALMSKFGGYAFNKSHSCMYAIVGYWTAYLKTYYPAEWLAACIEADKDDIDKIELYKTECQRLGLHLKFPSVNESESYTTVSESGEIFLPLTSLKGVGASAQSIIENKPYTGLEDFVERSGCNKSHFIALASGGALNCLSEETDLDEEYFLDFWLEYAKSKKVTKKKPTLNFVYKNSLSLLDTKKLSLKQENSNLLSLLDEDF